MPSLDKASRRIDERRDTVGGGSVLETGGGLAGPAIALPAPPTGFTVVNTALARSAITPSAVANLRWVRPRNIPVGTYLIQWATDSSFTTPISRDVPGDKITAAIPDLPTSPGVGTTTVYFRIATVTPNGLVGSFSAVISAAMPKDTTPPAAPTDFNYTWDGRTGDLNITWTSPPSDNLRDVRIQIYNNSLMTQLLRDEYSAVGRYTWSLAKQRSDTSGAYDSSVYVVLTARSSSGVFSTTSLTGTASLASPATPSGVTVDFTGPDAVFSLVAQTDAERYRWTIDGVTLPDTRSTQLTYTLAENTIRHSGTPDPILSYSVVAVNAIDRTSATAASGTATNTAPPTTAISLLAGFSSLAISLIPPSVSDFKRVRVRIYRDGTLVDTLYTTQTLLLWSATGAGSGSYTADATTYDVFDQPSTVTTSTAATVDVLTLAELRAGAAYSDSISTSPATLKAQLADGVRSSGGVTYASGTTWKWTQITRELTDRYEPLLITSTAGQGYIAVSNDGTTWTFYAGPLGANGVTLTQVANEAAAQAAPLTLPTSTAGRWDLPALAEARFVRLYHRNTAATYTIREWYAERVVEGDLIRAGTVRTLHLAAGAVVADTIAAGAVTAAKISVTQLSAITADLGTITAGTVTGATIRTAASGQRVELTSASGLRGIDSSNTVQIQINPATGKLSTSGDLITVSTADGIRINADAAYAAARSIRFVNSGLETTQNRAGSIYTLEHEVTSVAPGRIELRTLNTTTSGSVTVRISQDPLNSSGYGNSVTISGAGVRVGTAAGSVTAGELNVESNITTGGGLVTGGATPIAGGVVIRGASNGYYWHDRTVNTTQWAWYASGGIARLYNSVAAGDVMHVANDGRVGIGLAPTAGVAVRIGATGADNSTTTFGIAIQNSAGTLNNFFIRDDGAGFLRAGAWTFSDGRAKEKVRRLEHGLGALARLEGKRYDYTDGLKNQIGLVAQEVQAILPELVMELPDGQGLALNYSGLIPVLLNAVNELAGRVQQLEARPR
jgi:hypothetical protein